MAMPSSKKNVSGKKPEGINKMSAHSNHFKNMGSPKKMERNGSYCFKLICKQKKL
jgi:hypothetical protein